MYTRKRKSTSAKGRPKKRAKASFLRYGGYQAGPLGGGTGRRYTTQAIIRSPSNAPDRMFVKLKRGFVGNFSTAAAGAYASNYIRANSANDPLGSFGSGAPTGATPLLGASGSAVYGAYIVHACALTLAAVQTANASGCVVAVTPRFGTAAVPTSIGQQIAEPRTKWIQCAAGTGLPAIIKMMYTTAQVYGQAPQTVAITDSFGATYNSDPASEVRWDIGIGGNAAELEVVQLSFVMTQWVELFGRWTES